MKRNLFGINLDEGVPLSKEDYEILFVDFFGDASLKLRSWIEVGDAPTLLGGQIGSGKSTLIAKGFNDTGRMPDMVLHFDRETLNFDIGDFLGITLAGFIETALLRNIDLTLFNLPEELNPDKPGDWKALFDVLSPHAFTMQSFTTAKQLRKTIANNAEYIATTVINIGKHIETSIGQPLIIFASGIDKFDTKGAASIAINDIVTTLSSFKTLFEVNAVHLFSQPASSFHTLDRIFVPAAKEEVIVEMLSKRLGVYAKPLNDELKSLAECSGGNPRQALRLLSHFESARKNRNRTVTENLAIAMRETRSDFFSYAPKPSTDLMKTIKQTRKIGANLFLLPGDKETARTALYGNWIFLSEPSNGDSWGAIPNPLVSGYFENTLVPDDLETQILHKYAEAYGISSFGLGLSRYDDTTGKEKSPDQLLWEFRVSVDQPIQSNLTEVLDVLGAALLSKDRPDRAIIAFKDKSITEAARAYLFGKANTYEYQRYKHTVITGGAGTEPLLMLEEFLSEDTDIYSIEFGGNWTSNQLELLDKHRDSFITKQILWWIPFAHLKSYLPHWTQLRQLFEIFVLDDELLGSILPEDIEADLAFFEDLAENVQSSEANVVSNLKNVLEYLKAARAEVAHG